MDIVRLAITDRFLPRAAGQQLRRQLRRHVPCRVARVGAETRQDHRRSGAVGDAERHDLRRSRARSPCGAAFILRIEKIAVPSPVAVEDEAQKPRSVQKSHLADGIEAAPMEYPAWLQPLP